MVRADHHPRWSIGLPVLRPFRLEVALESPAYLSNRETLRLLLSVAWVVFLVAAYTVLALVPVVWITKFVWFHVL